MRRSSRSKVFYVYFMKRMNMNDLIGRRAEEFLSSFFESQDLRISDFFQNTQLQN